MSRKRDNRPIGERIDDILNSRMTLYVTAAIVALIAAGYFFPVQTIAFIAIILALSLHEFGHAAMADRMGDPTPRMQGRLTLNPIAHLDPMGTIFIVMTMIAGFGFGWGKPVQTNPTYYKNYKQGRVLVAVAGPAMNLAQAMVMVGIAYILFSLNVQLSAWVHIFVFYYIMINVVLMVFNMLPIPPLDGGHVLEMMLPWKLRPRFQRLAPFGMLILLGLMWFGILWYVISFFQWLTVVAISAGFGNEFVSWLGL